MAVSLTFDVDAEAPHLGRGEKYQRYLSTLSDARFGVNRGMPKILALLSEHNLLATFFIPGETARRYPRMIEEVLSRGHEIGHHGDLHKATHTLSGQEQMEELQGGLEALRAAGASRPRGYRSPGFEMMPETFSYLCSNNFLYDSSLMEDDRPYIASHEGRQILELPVSWTLDDWPLLGWSPHSQSAKLGTAETLLSRWLTEYREARMEGRHVNFTMHPEVIGRSSRFVALRQLVESITADAGVWFAKMEDVARHAMSTLAQEDRNR